VDINRIAIDVGVSKMSKERYKELRNLNLLDVPTIKKSLIHRERTLGHSEDKIEENIKLIASGIKLRTFTDSRNPFVRRIGTSVRKLAVYELCLLDYTESELVVILDVSKDTIRRDIQSIEDDILSRQWWRKPTKTSGFQITQEWESSSPACTSGESRHKPCLEDDGKCRV